MTSVGNTYSPSLAAAVAREHVIDRLRHAASRAVSELPRRDRHRTPRRRALC
jgi:transcriptional regulator GlxA family with amidase domain